MSPFSGLSLGAVKDPAPLLNMEHRDIVIVIVAMDKPRVQTLLIWFWIAHCGIRRSCYLQAVYFYQSDGRGPCLAFEGEKLQLHWYRGYMLVVGKENKPFPRGYSACILLELCL